MAKSKLFRESIKKLSKIKNENLSISFDHNSQILLGPKNRDRLYEAKKALENVINLLIEID